MTASADSMALLTPPGSGALAVLALRGPGAWSALQELFRPASGRPLPESPPEAGRVMFGRLGDDSTADEVVLTVQQSGPVPWLELHVHGGRQVADWLMELFQQRGVVQVNSFEFLADQRSPALADALQALAAAPTTRTASILLDQFNGALAREVEPLRRLDRDAALARVNRLLEFAPLGRHLTRPWRVVIGGRPNVGKSSLVNALAGYQRSIVAPIPGTTRDAVSVTIALDGWPVELIDTAGIRDAVGELEAAGIGVARTVLGEADLVIWLIDASDPAPPEPPPVPAMIVANKCDLPCAADYPADLRISARTGEGIASLVAVLSRQLVSQAPSPGQAVPFTAAQCEALERLRRALEGKDAAASDRAWAALDLCVPPVRDA